MIAYLKIMKPFGLRVLIDLRYLKALLLLPAMISWHQAQSQSSTFVLPAPQEVQVVPEQPALLVEQAKQMLMIAIVPDAMKSSLEVKAMPSGNVNLSALANRMVS